MCSDTKTYVISLLIDIRHLNTYVFNYSRGSL